MDREQLKAVLGHEIGHVANGDMVTLALVQGVLNTFVIVLARVIGGIVDGWLSGGRDTRGGGIAYFLIVIVLQIVLGIFASMIVMAFSRWREFRADAAGANLAGRGSMISALERLRANHGENTLAKTDGCVWNLRSYRDRVQASVHESPTAGGAHRRPAGGVTGALKRWSDSGHGPLLLSCFTLILPRELPA